VTCCAALRRLRCCRLAVSRSTQGSASGFRLHKQKQNGPSVDTETMLRVTIRSCSFFLRYRTQQAFGAGHSKSPVAGESELNSIQVAGLFGAQSSNRKGQLLSIVVQVQLWALAWYLALAEKPSTSTICHECRHSRDEQSSTVLLPL
jgi:hypothetical protein